MSSKLACVGWLLAVGTFAAAAATPVKGPPRELTLPSHVRSPAMPRMKSIALEDFFGVSGSSSAAWSADGHSILYTSSQSGRMNLWSQPLEGGSPTQLSKSDQRQSIAAVTPDGKSIIYSSDEDGREIYDLYTLPTGAGEAQNLTATDDMNETAAIISPKGEWLAFSARTRTESASNVAIMDLAKHTRRALTHETVDGVQWTPIAFSRDGLTLIVNRFDYNLTFGEVYRIDVSTGTVVQITPAGTYATATDISPDGRYVALVLETHDGRRQAALLDLRTAATSFISPSPWEQTTASFSPDGKTVLVITNEDGREETAAYVLANHKTTRLLLPTGTNSAGTYAVSLPKFSPDGTEVLFAHTSGSEPLEYWVYSLLQNRARQITHLTGLDTSSLPQTQIVHYGSKDGTVISAIMWMPHNLKRDGSNPAILFVHGGPTGQTQDRFSVIPMALASRGYVVLAPNYRGSTGYGRAFLDANKLDIGGGDLDDVVAGAKFLTDTGYVNTRKIGITGGSYGGYMTMIALAKTPAVWAAGVEMFGIVNWRTMWKNSPPQNRRYQAGLLGDPDKNAELYDKASPLTHLRQVRAPLLVLQGENDPRVPAAEAHQVVDALKRGGQIVDSRFYAGEGHGFARRETQVDSLERLVAWFDKYLKGK